MQGKFVYNINLVDSIPVAARLDDNTQAYIESCIVRVVYESFVLPGDQDYVTARLLAQKGLHRAFYWAASQTIEKYLKALIVLNGKSVQGSNGHSIKSLFEKSLEINPDLAKADLSPHKDLNVDSRSKHFIETFSVKEFVADLDNHGKSDNRYNSSGVIFNTGHLFALDGFCHKLRGEIGGPNIYESFKKADESLVSAFCDNNFWFYSDGVLPHSKIPSKEFPIKMSSSVTRLDFLIDNINDNNHKLALTWLFKKMKLPKKIKGLIGG